MTTQNMINLRLKRDEAIAKGQAKRDEQNAELAARDAAEKLETQAKIRRLLAAHEYLADWDPQAIGGNIVIRLPGCWDIIAQWYSEAAPPVFYGTDSDEDYTGSHDDLNVVVTEAYEAFQRRYKIRAEREEAEEAERAKRAREEALCYKEPEAAMAAALLRIARTLETDAASRSGVLA